jgi:hypothetical protein
MRICLIALPSLLERLHDHGVGVILTHEMPHEAPGVRGCVEGSGV